MITRVRIEAEGSTPDEVMRQLDTAHAALKIETLPVGMADLMFGEPNENGAREGLADAQTGECVIERFGRDTGGEAGHGGIVYKGRMTAHYAKPQKLMKLTGHSTWPGTGPVAETPLPRQHPDWVPPLATATDATLTEQRLIATWNEHMPPSVRGKLWLYVQPGDTYVRAEQLWQTSEVVRSLYERPVENMDMGTREWMVSREAGLGAAA